MITMIRVKKCCATLMKGKTKFPKLWNFDAWWDFIAQESTNLQCWLMQNGKTTKSFGDLGGHETFFCFFFLIFSPIVNQMRLLPYLSTCNWWMRKLKDENFMCPHPLYYPLSWLEGWLIFFYSIFILGTQLK